MAVLFVGEHAQLQLVGVGQGVGRQLVVFGGRQHADPLVGRVGAGVVAGQRIVQVGGPGLARQQVQVQRQLHQHALAEIAHRRREDRAARHAGVAHDFRQVLVAQAQRIGLERRRCALFVGFDHGAPAARVATHRWQRHRKVGWQQAGVHQRTQQGNGAGGVATRIGHALGALDGRHLARAQLGETIDPAFGTAVRRAGIDDAWAVARQSIGHGHRLDGGIVVQTQQHHIGFAHQRALGLGVLAARRVDAQYFNSRHALQTLADLQAGGACLTVDENLRHGRKSFC